jgi:hypothetical protein
VQDAESGSTVVAVPNDDPPESRTTRAIFELFTSVMYPASSSTIVQSSSDTSASRALAAGGGVDD